MTMSTSSRHRDSLQEKLKEIKDGTVQLPEFQRDWRWNDEHIKSLIASIAQSFPIGAVMLLENGGTVRFEPRRIAGTNPKIDEVTPDTLILDGQQRLTALFQSLISEQAVKTLDSKNREIKRWYYLDMKECVSQSVNWDNAVVSVPENLIINRFRRDKDLDLSTPQKEYEQNFFPVSKIFDTDSWMQGFIEHWKLNPEKWHLYQKFNNEVIKSFEQYRIPLIVLDKDTPKEAICQIFEKVNQQGIELNVFELLTASLAAEEFSLRDDWKLRQKSLRRYKVLRKLGDVNFLQALTLLVTKNQNSTVSCKRKDILELDRNSYEDWSNHVEKGFIKAARFLHGQKIFDAKNVPYSAQLVPLAAILTYLEDLSETELVQQKIARWYWCGVLGEMYAGSTDTRSANDFLEVINWVTEGGKEPTTIHDSNFLENRLARLQSLTGAVYKGIYALIMQDRGTVKCSDFRTGIAIDEKVFFDDSINIHHIFPKAWCEKNNINRNDYNSIINKTAISARTNQKIGSRAPSVYLDRIQTEVDIDQTIMDRRLDSHLICPNSLRTDDFWKFFIARKNALIEVIEKAMDKKVIREDDESSETSE